MFGTITHFPSLNIFHIICGPHICHQCSFFIFYFFISFFSTQTHWIQWKKKTKRKEKKNRTANPGKEKKKRTKANASPERKKKGGQKLRLWVPYVCLITILPLSYELWKQSYGNRVIVCQTNFLLWVPPFLSYELWKQRIKLSKNPIQTGS